MRAIKKIFPKVSFLLLILSWSSLSYAATVVQLELAELSQYSDKILHARVADVDAYFGAKEGGFRTLIRFEIIETIKGESKPTLDMVIPGGSMNENFVWIPGMPQFKVHDEVMVFLEQNSDKTYAFTGLSQGVFFIEHIHQLPTLKQNLDGTHILNQPVSKAPLAPQTLHHFLKTVRSHTRDMLP